MEPHIIEEELVSVGESEESEQPEESEELDSESSDNYSDIDDETDFKTELQYCLDDVQHEGTFSAFQHHKRYPNPGLYVKGLGTVGLPLSTRDATAIAALCKKSSFGRGDETVVDESVRKTWELDASEIECKNPTWMSFQETLAKQATEDIGVQVAAQAQPYKLLLYGEGAFFKAHRDTEKVPGMFGTMVVCLPSEHTGGEVYLTHGGKERILQTAATSAFDLSALAWYSDVKHEIKPVLSGYRLVLTYNLIQDQTLPRQTAAALDANHQKLERLLGAWNRNYDYIDYLAYPLSFKYTESSLAFKNLKGQDAAKGRYLESGCAKNGVYWLLSQMTKQKEEDDDYGYGEVEEKHSFGETFLPSGQSLCLGLGLVEEDLLLADLEDLYGGRDPDSEDEGEYTGNENMPATHRYHDTVIILIRKKHVLRGFRFDNRQTAESLLAFFSLMRGDPACTESMRRDAMTAILEKAMAIVTMHDDGSYRSNYLLGYAREVQDMKRAEYAKVFETVSDYCYLNGLSSIVSKLIRDAMQDKQWTSSKSLVGLIAKKVAIEASSGKENVWSEWLTTSLPLKPTYTYANEQLAMYDMVREMLPSTSASSFDVWRDARIEEVINAVQSYSEDDAQSILDLIPKLPSHTYFESIIPTLTNSPHSAGLSRFLYLLAKNDLIHQKDIAETTYRRLAQTATANLKLSAEAITSRPLYNTYGQKGLESIRADELLGIVECYMKLELTHEAAQLLGASLPDVPDGTSGLSEKWRLMFHFLSSLATFLSRYKDSELRNSATPFVTSLLHTAAKHTAHARPQEPLKWARTESKGYGHKKCTCEPCNALRMFLFNPNESVGRFSYNKSIRSHLEYKLDRQDYKFDTDKSRSPHTLVVTKTNNKYHRDLQEWNYTIMEMRRELEKFNMLLKPLGITATETANLDAQLVAAGTAEGVVQVAQPVNSASALPRNVAAPQQVAGVKRKAIVVDLTED